MGASSKPANALVTSPRHTRNLVGLGVPEGQLALARSGGSLSQLTLRRTTLHPHAPYDYNPQLKIIRIASNLLNVNPDRTTSRQ
jgi:hypothetical protein